jgi:hypothetical protein
VLGDIEILRKVWWMRRCMFLREQDETAVPVKSR